MPQSRSNARAVPMQRLEGATAVGVGSLVSKPSEASSLPAAASDDGASSPSKHKSAAAASTSTASYLALVGGVFVFYIAHDALQERLFRTPGFEFGAAMTVAELTAMAVGSSLSRCVQQRTLTSTPSSSAAAAASGRMFPPLPVLLLNAALVLLIILSQTSGSQALNYVNFPVKVCFKSAKVLPTMAFSIFITGRRYPPIQYAAAVCVVAALILMSLADYHADHDATQEGGEIITHSAADMIKGMQLLAVATLADAVVPNIQERILSKMKTPLDEMIFWSNVGALLLLGVVTVGSGELARAVHFCTVESPTSGLYLGAQALCAFLGLRLYLTIVKRFGGVVGVMTTSARKGVTLILSYALFRKPLSAQHVAGAASLLLALYLSAMAKRSKSSSTGPRRVAKVVKA